MTANPNTSLLILTKDSELLSTLEWSRIFLHSAPDKVFTTGSTDSGFELAEEDSILFDQLDQLPGDVFRALNDEKLDQSAATPIQLLVNPPLDQNAACLREAVYAANCPEDRLCLFGMLPRNQQNLLVRSFFSLFHFPVPFYAVFAASLIPFLTLESTRGKFFPVNLLWQLKRAGITIISHAIDPHNCEVQHVRRVTWLHLLVFGLGTFLRFSLSSLASLLVDNLVFSLSYFLSGKIGVSLIFGRAVSMIVNYLLLRNSVFVSSGESINGKNQTKASNFFDKGTFFRYLLLVIFSGMVVWLVTGFLSVELGINTLIAKLGIELIMFFVNYFLSKNLVFRKK